MSNALLAMAKKAGNKKIVKHNDLIEAKIGLGLMGTRIFLKALSLIHREDVDFKVYTIIVSELLEECGVSSNNYEVLKQEAESLASITLKLPTKNKKGFLYTGLVSSIEYVPQKGWLELIFDPKLKPYLLQVKGNFTTYELQYVFLMKSQYSIRIYELLKQYATFGRRKIDLDGLRHILSLEDKYPNFADFKKRVIEPARKECSLFSDISFTYKPIKKGRKTVGLDFTIKRKSNEAEVTEDGKVVIPITYSDFIQELLDAGLSEERVSEILERYKSEEYLKFVWKVVKSQNPKKLDGFFLKALQDGYYEKNFAEAAAQKQIVQKKQQVVHQLKVAEQAEQEFNKKFNAFYNAAADRIEKETLSTRLEDRQEFEVILQDKIEENPAWQLSYDSYINGDMTLFRNFLVRKYGKEYEYDKKAYKAYINQK